MSNVGGRDSEHFEENDDYIKIRKSYSSGMIVEPRIFIDRSARAALFLDDSLKQMASVCKLPGVVDVVGLPDMHGGYDFPIGCVAAINMNDEHAVISPGGVGYDINCGVRTMVTNLDFESFSKKQAEVADRLYEKIPTGVGPKGMKLELTDLDLILDLGVDGLNQLGIVNDNLEYIEDRGRMDADSRLMSQKCKGRGINQLGSVGSGNHYVEIQRVTEIFDAHIAHSFGIVKKDQIIYTIHTGSRGVGHEVYTEFPEPLALTTEKSRHYMMAAGCAANYAWANRSLISKSVEDVLREMFVRAEFGLVYDVSHNIAKKEKVFYNGVMGEYLVQRKGASRAFSYDLPLSYSLQQPIPVGGSMGTCSYILAGQQESLRKTIGSCCHGAGRLHSRGKSKKMWTESEVLEQMRGIEVRYGTTQGLVEEAPGAYKDVTVVVDHCEKIGITKKVCKVEPVVVIKG